MDKQKWKSSWYFPSKIKCYPITDSNGADWSLLDNDMTNQLYDNINIFITFIVLYSIVKR